MARGTKLFQQPRSPLIQGRSRRTRPFWQPWIASVLIGLAWPIASALPHEFAEAGLDGIGDAVAVTLASWGAGLGVLVPAVVAGAALGVSLGNMWGTRLRWVPGAVGAVGAWYFALVLVGLVAR